MHSEYTPKDWEQFDKNYRKLTREDNILREKIGMKIICGIRMKCLLKLKTIW